MHAYRKIANLKINITCTVSHNHAIVLDTRGVCVWRG